MATRRKPPVDPGTWSAASGILADRSGRDQVELLYAAGLILTPAVEAEIVERTLRRVEQGLEEWTTGDFLALVKRRGAVGSAVDMHRAVLTWVRSLR